MKLHRDCGFGEVSRMAPQLESVAELALSDDGTAHAINYYTSGVSAVSAQSKGRGGARNRADRESEALTPTQVGNLTAAVRHAHEVGLPLTRMVSIHWEAAGVPLEGMAKATGHFVDLMSKAMARHGISTAWVWVHENCGPKGGHCHLLAHVPADFISRLTALQRGWLRRITGKPYRARVIHSKPIGGRLGLEQGNPTLHALNLDAALGYVLKGANAEAASQFELKRLEPSGRIIGKRCGTSQNIGAKARNAKDSSWPKS